MATLTVGAGKQYGTIAAALGAAREGDTVAVQAGTYLNEAAVARVGVNLMAVGGKVVLQGTSPLAGKALLTMAAGGTVDGFTFQGAHNADGTAAGLRLEGGALTVRNSLFLGNQTGLAAVANAMANAMATLTVQASEFGGNGTGDGFGHNLAVGAIKGFTLTDSYVHDAAGGQEVRSRAAVTTITNSRILDGAAASGFAIDLPTGGVVALRGNTIQKGANATSPAAIRFGAEALQTGSSLVVAGNTVLSDKPGVVLLQNASAVAATLTGNQFFGLAGLATGAVSASGNVLLGARPSVAGAAPVAGGLPPLVDRGRAGAVVANGAVLLVGADAPYRTLAQALAAARDGDTIRVAAGTYVNDGAVIERRVIIEGVGGLARFVAIAPPSNGLATFVTRADVTFRNLEVFGAGSPGGAVAAIRAEAGVLTLVNATIHDNQAGIVATGASVGVFDTELARNGTADGRGLNLDMGPGGSLVARNVWVHDGAGGPEIRSRAENTVLEGVRVSQFEGVGGAALDLPVGGRVSVEGSALEKGAGSQAAPVLQVGGGSVLAGSSVALANTTLVNDRGDGSTPFVSNTAQAVALTVTNGVFVGGAEGSAQVTGGTVVNATVAAGVQVSTAAPWGPQGAPAAAPVTVAPAAARPAEFGVLRLQVSGDAYRGLPQFSLVVDGVAVGGTLTATASRAAGQSQMFTVAGQFAAGAHAVSVRFLNDLQGAGPGEDRNLYVDGMSYNGEDFGTAAVLRSNGSVVLTTGPVLRQAAVTVALSEEAWRGDARAFIAIDGRVLGGVQAVGAAHGAGATQTMSFLTELAPGPHLATVTMLNPDPQGARKLYVDWIEVAGQRMAGALAPVQGTAVYGITVPPPLAANGALFVTAGLPELLVPA